MPYLECYLTLSKHQITVNHYFTQNGGRVAQKLEAPIFEVSVMNFTHLLNLVLLLTSLLYLTYRAKQNPSIFKLSHSAGHICHQLFVVFRKFFVR